MRAKEKDEGGKEGEGREGGRGRGDCSFLAQLRDACAREITP